MRAEEMKGHLDAMLLAGKRADGRDFDATVSGVLEGERLCPGPA
jgi:hypothetical protein